jgi:hypothetical protein
VLENIRTSTKRHIKRFLSPELARSDWGVKLDHSSQRNGAMTRVLSNSTITTDNASQLINQNYLSLKGLNKADRRGVSNVDSTVQELRNLLDRGVSKKPRTTSRMSFIDKSQAIDKLWTKHTPSISGVDKYHQGKSGVIKSRGEFTEMLSLATPNKKPGISNTRLTSDWKSPGKHVASRDMTRMVSPSSIGKMQVFLDKTTSKLPNTQPPLSDLFSGLSRRRGSGANPNSKWYF